MRGSIVSVATVARTRVAGAEVSGDHRVDGAGSGDAVVRAVMSVAAVRG